MHLVYYNKSLQQLHQVWPFSLGMTSTLKGSGCRTTPTLPCRSGGGAPSGSRKLIRWSREDRKRKSSILANDSPTHTRGPAPKGRKEGGVTRQPLSSRKRSGTNDKASVIFTLQHTLVCYNIMCVCDLVCVLVRECVWVCCLCVCYLVWRGPVAPSVWGRGGSPTCLPKLASHTW